MPPDLASAYPWRTQAEWLLSEWVESRVDSGQDEASELRLHDLARILSGRSAVNGLPASQRSPCDYGGWAVNGWAWSDVLPRFKKLGADAVVDGPLHGRCGPVSVQRHRLSDWTGFTRTVLQIFTGRDYPVLEDQNGPWIDGTCSTAVNFDQPGRFAGVVTSYPLPDTHRCSNPMIATETCLERPTTPGGAVIGAVLDVFVTGHSQRTKHLARNGRSDGTLTTLAGPLIDFGATLRRRPLNYRVGTRLSPSEAAEDARVQARCGQSARMRLVQDGRYATSGNGHRYLGASDWRRNTPRLIPTVFCANINSGYPEP